ncbi:unnamed protein product [Prunus brigantina]
MSLLGGGLQASETWQAKDHIYLHARSLHPPERSLHPISFIYIPPNSQWPCGPLLLCLFSCFALYKVRWDIYIYIHFTFHNEYIYVCVCINSRKNN